MNNNATTYTDEMISDDALTTVYANQHISKSIGQPEEGYDALRLNYSRKWARLEDALLFKFREDLEKGNSLSWINKTEESRKLFDTIFLFSHFYGHFDATEIDAANFVRMTGTFTEAACFPDLSGWDVSNVLYFTDTFKHFRGEVDISNWKINPKAQVTLNTLTYSMLHTDRLGELHWLWASQFTHGALKGHKEAVYSQMRGEQKDIYMHHMDSASNALSVAGKPNVQDVDVARLAWSSYTGRDMVQSIDIPESFDFTF